MESYIQTFTGKWIDPLNPDPDLIDPIDIAHALALVNRFTGHTTEPYSVAQHSCGVYDLVSHENKKYAILHDASEAYIGDIARPVKHQNKMELYREIEDNLMEAILNKYDLEWPLPDEVKWADEILLYSELRDLMGFKPNGHGVIPSEIKPWTSWKTSKLQFINRLRAVEIEIEDAVLL